MTSPAAEIFKKESQVATSSNAAYSDSIPFSRFSQQIESPSFQQIHPSSNAPTFTDLSLSTQSPAPTSSARASTPNWTCAETKVLAKAFIYVSEDPIVGTNQTSERFAIRLFEAYKRLLVNESLPDFHRSVTAVQHSWKKIRNAITKFVGYFRYALAHAESGTTEEDWIKEAEAKYHEATRGYYKYKEAWQVLRQIPKFADRIDGAPPTHLASQFQQSATSTHAPFLQSLESTRSFSWPPTAGSQFQQSQRSQSSDSSTDAGNDAASQLAMASIVETFISRISSTPPSIDAYYHTSRSTTLLQTLVSLIDWKEKRIETEQDPSIKLHLQQEISRMQRKLVELQNELYSLDEMG